MHVARGAVWAVLAAAACSKPSVEPAPAPPPTVTTPPSGSDEVSPPPAPDEPAPEQAPPPLPGAKPGPPSGTYLGAACPGRAYERVVKLGSDGSIDVEDRVSPCPPGARCVWSGIVVRAGTYAVEPPAALGKPFRVILSMKGASDPKAAALPPHLLWWESRGELTEPDEKCRYVAQP